MQNQLTNISNQFTLAIHSTDNTYGFAYRKKSDFDYDNFFINKFDKNNINKLNKNIALIYRNYNEKNNFRFN